MAVERGMGSGVRYSSTTNAKSKKRLEYAGKGNRDRGDKTLPQLAASSLIRLVPKIYSNSLRECWSSLATKNGLRRVRKDNRITPAAQMSIAGANVKLLPS